MCPVEFGAVDGTELIGDLSRPEHSRAGAILCHPHPQFGGNRFNHVVGAMFDALPAADIAALRFDFGDAFPVLAPEVEPQRGDVGGGQRIEHGPDDVVEAVAAELRVRMADDRTGPAVFGARQVAGERHAVRGLERHGLRVPLRILQHGP